jgi:methylmalonyl-CoA carboxyltransferase small subunit
LKLQITIDGKVYEVGVELVEDDEELPQPRYEPATLVPPAVRTYVRAAATDTGDTTVCRSPVTGLVIRVNVEPGQPVNAGELILVLEAMKMETNVVAPRAATIKSVLVAPGDPVKASQVLVEFD